jgi:hypothetical protein
MKKMKKIVFIILFSFLSISIFSQSNIISNLTNNEFETDKIEYINMNGQYIKNIPNTTGLYFIKKVT